MSNIVPTHQITIKGPKGLEIKATGSLEALSWMQNQLGLDRSPVSGQPIPHHSILNEWYRCKKLSVASFVHAVQWAESIHGVQS